MKISEGLKPDFGAMMDNKITIELTDVNTGEVEKHEVKNIMTKLMKAVLWEAFRSPWVWYMDPINHGTDATQKSMERRTEFRIGERDYGDHDTFNGFPARYLYLSNCDEPIDPEMDHFPPESYKLNSAGEYYSGDVIVAYNSLLSPVYSGTDDKRGSLNQYESKHEFNKTTLVVEWPTYAGNGEINSIMIATANPTSPSPHLLNMGRSTDILTGEGDFETILTGYNNIKPSRGFAIPASITNNKVYSYDFINVEDGKLPTVTRNTAKFIADMPNPDATRCMDLMIEAPHTDGKYYGLSITSSGERYDDKNHPPYLEAYKSDLPPSDGTPFAEIGSTYYNSGMGLINTERASEIYIIYNPMTKKFLLFGNTKSRNAADVQDNQVVIYELNPGEHTIPATPVKTLNGFRLTQGDTADRYGYWGPFIIDNWIYFYHGKPGTPKYFEKGPYVSRFNPITEEVILVGLNKLHRYGTYDEHGLFLPIAGFPGYSAFLNDDYYNSCHFGKTELMGQNYTRAVLPNTVTKLPTQTMKLTYEMNFIDAP